MKSYAIITADGNQTIIIATSQQNPFSDIKDIEKDLNALNVKGRVIFDLLLCNGFNKSRYLTSFFNTSQFVNNSAYTIGNVSVAVMNAVSKYMVENKLFA